MDPRKLLIWGKAFFLLAAFVSCQIVFAQNETNQLKFEHLQSKDGLLDDIVTCFLQDSKGFMWFGTYKGLCRYDGVNLKTFVYGTDPKFSLKSDVVSALCEDKFGKIWIGTPSESVSIYDPVSETFEHLAAGGSDSLLVTHANVYKIIRDSRGNMWIGTQNGMSKISPDRKQVERFRPNDGAINGSSVFDLTEDGVGRIWIATDNSLLNVYNPKTKRFEEKKYTKLPLLDEDDNQQKRLHLQGDTALWVVSNNGGLSCLNLTDFSFSYHTTQADGKGLSTMQIRDVLSVGSKLWLATEGNGIDIFDLKTRQFENFRKSQLNNSSLSSDVIWSLYKDKQNNIWVGTYNGGICKYDPRKNFFSLINHYAKDTFNPVLSLYEDTEQNLWVGTDWGGLFCLSKKGEIKHYTEKNGLSTNVIKSICSDGNGKLLLGTFNHGMMTFDPKAETFEYHKKEPGFSNGLTNNNIWTLFNDSEGEIWVGTSGDGIFSYDAGSKRFSQVAISNSNVAQLHTYHSFEDSHSNVWISTDWGVLLYKRSERTWTSIIPSNELGIQNITVNKVRAVFEDRERNIWLSTAAGLISYENDENQWRLFSLSDGLPELPLLNLHEDGQGNLILISRTYISQFDLEEKTITSYKVNDNVFSYATLIKSAEGKFLVGGRNGITSFSSEALQKNTFAPEVYITGFSVLNQKQSPTSTNSLIDQAIETLDEIQIDYSHNVVSFEFSALNFSENERNQFAYKLEGFDKTWNYITNRKEVTYTNLDPGEYTFRVKASNNHNVWNEKGTSLKLVVRPPYYKTMWFRALIVLALISLFLLLQRLRLRQIKRDYENQRLKKEREISQLKTEKLNAELASAHSELSNITMSHIHTNQKLQKIRQQLSDSIKESNVADVRPLQRLLKAIDREIQNNDHWDEFEHQFNKSHDNFLERLKTEYSDLSKRELRICAYLRMGLDNHEIASLMNVTVGTVGTARYRIRKKMGIEDRKSLTKMIVRF